MGAAIPLPHWLPGNAAGHGGRLAVSVAAFLLLVGCASVEPGGPGPLRGSSGPVAWEVSDIGRVVSSDNQRIRWSYLITLRNASDRVIQLERVERAATSQSSETVGGSPVSQPFRRTLGARSELRISMSDNWGWLPWGSSTTFGGAATLRPIMVFRHFRGTDDRGTPVQIRVQVRLDPSVGRLARPATTPKSLPAPKTLESDPELVTLAGVWRGSYRLDNTLLDVPIELTILADGTCQVAENEPVTNRFRRAVRVKDGRLEYSGDRERGTLTLHEAEGRRMLTGRVSQIDGQPYTIYLEAQSATSAAPSPAESGGGDPHAPHLGAACAMAPGWNQSQPAISCRRGRRPTWASTILGRPPCYAR